MDTVSDIDNCIQHLQQELEAALELKAKVENDLRQCTRAISQDTNLPTELLIHIFKYVSMEYSPFLGSLMQVCRLWKNIILSTPQLWSTIHLEYSKDVSRLDKFASYCISCLERSGNFPLDIQIESTALPTFQNVVTIPMRRICLSLDVMVDMERTETLYSFLRRRDACFHNIYKNHLLKPLEILANYKYSKLGYSPSSRWRSVKWAFTNVDFHYPFLEAAIERGIFSGPMPLLETLNLRYIRADMYTIRKSSALRLESIRASRAFRDFSNIRRLLLNDIELCFYIGSINPLQLNELDMVAYSFNYYDFAIKCSNLVRLRLGVSFSTRMNIYHDKDMQWSPCISFPQLIHLQLAHWAPPRLLQSLHAPLLRTIIFETSGATYNLKFNHNLPSVTRIELWGELLDRDQRPQFFKEILKHCPSLTIILCSDREQEHAKQVLDILHEKYYSKQLPVTLEIMPQGIAGKKIAMMYRDWQ